MYSRISIALVLMMTLFIPTAPALAQAGCTVTLMPATLPVSDAVSQAVTDLLQSACPANTTYYAISNANRTPENDWVVSVVGVVNVANAAAAWQLENNVIYTGLMKLVLLPDGSYSAAYYEPEMPSGAGGTAGPGGGATIAFPFKNGTNALYGVRGIHAVGYGQSNMVAVDLVGGPTYGADTMPPIAYAAADGVIDFVCTDPYTTAVRVRNTAGDFFIYAHLENNANLVEGHFFATADPIATLRAGSFCSGTNPASDCRCGWAEQTSQTYHLHWGIVPFNGTYQAEGCILTLSTQKWICAGAEEISVGEYLTSGLGGTAIIGGTSTDPDKVVIIYDPNAPGGVRLTGGHIWDYFLNGAFSIFASLLSVFPVHQTQTFWEKIAGMFSEFFLLANTFLVGYVNFTPIVIAFGIVGVSELAYWLFAGYRFFRKIFI